MVPQSILREPSYYLNFASLSHMWTGLSVHQLGLGKGYATEICFESRNPR